jgi:hypothetical protein
LVFHHPRQPNEASNSIWVGHSGETLETHGTVHSPRNLICASRAQHLAQRKGDPNGFRVFLSVSLGQEISFMSQPRRLVEIPRRARHSHGSEARQSFPSIPNFFRLAGRVVQFCESRKSAADFVDLSHTESLKRGDLLFI